MLPPLPSLSAVAVDAINQWNIYLSMKASNTSILCFPLSSRTSNSSSLCFPLFSQEDKKQGSTSFALLLLPTIFFSTSAPCLCSSESVLASPALGVPMAELVATMVVEPLLSIVKEKVSSYILEQHEVMKGMEEQHEILKHKLSAILDIITDAEQTAAHREGVTAWLEEVRTVAYEANEVFDEFKYEALRRKAKKEGHYKELGFDVVKLFPTHNRFVFRMRMARKLRKIVKDIEVLVAEMNAFGFKYLQQMPVLNQWRQTDHVIFDPKKIISRSRAKDNKNVVDILLGQANNADLTVVPIVGMGGLGKTTLAQLVYNDPEIQKHFDVLLWVCVSNNFDVDSLARSIVEAAPEKKNDGTEVTTASKTKKTPLDILQNVLSGQRYLLVLDDVWTREDDKWERLKARLEHGGMGIVVLITTRDKLVAEILGTAEAYNLGALGGQYVKEIIETKAFSRLKKEEKRPAVLVNMVDEIVERCAGSPLAAIALGSILRNKTSEEEWRAISSRSNICTKETGILPILKLSYNDLPSHMKQCFAFCAIFPKDYEIDVDKLIQLWIAHGFIIQEQQVRLETIGKQIFNELASRSFFQDVKQVQATVREIEWNGASYSRTTCKIHDLMHDVALSVMGKECALATNIECVVATEVPSQRDFLTKTTRHVFLSCKTPETKLNRSLENCSPAIRTLLCDGYVGSLLQHQSKYSSLQALQLCIGSSFPLKPKHLHHLRYLDLSKSGIKALPEDISILYNLQTLNLFGCGSLGELPRQMKYMTALRHLYTHGCPMLDSMPRDLRKLTSLQTLTCFVAGIGSNCSNIGELEHLNLGVQLELCHLENVTEEDAKAANLVKKELRELTFKWTIGKTVPQHEENDARVLQKLEPHDGLDVLTIHSYGATTFPTWMSMLQNVAQIHLFHCKKLQWLFSRGTGTSSAFPFPNLKVLTLVGLVCLERWWESNNGLQGDKIMFPGFEKLFIHGCEKLAALPGHPNFPNLQHTIIKGCPELTTTAKSPKLSVLNMKGSEGELFGWVARHMTSLTNLKLQSLDDSTKTTSEAAMLALREVLDGREKWNGHDFPLAVLLLKDFTSDVSELCGCFVHLQDLAIECSDALVHWPEKEFQRLVFLRRLFIRRCRNLTGCSQALADPPIASPTTQLLPCLESLQIRHCSRLIEVFNVPTSLRKMDIRWCSNLESPFGRRLQPGQSALLIQQGASSIPLEVSSSSPPKAGAEHLEELTLTACDALTGVLHLPPSLKKLYISYCDGLTTLESRAGELPSLKYLQLMDCKILSSLPNGPQAYSSLQHLYIINCPGVKTLPTGLQQRLGSLQGEDIDGHHYKDTTRVGC